MGMVVVTILWFTTVTVLVVFGVRRSLRERGQRQLHRVRDVIVFAYTWLLLGVFPLLLVLTPHDVSQGFVWVLAVLAAPVLLFMLLVYVWDQVQYAADRRRDNDNGVPAWPKPRSWTGAFVAGFIVTVLTMFAVVFIWLPWLILNNISTALTNADRSMTLSQIATDVTIMQPPTGAFTWCLVIAFTVGIMFLLWWKLSRDAAVKARHKLEKGLAYRLNAEREIGRDEGRAERIL